MGSLMLVMASSLLDEHARLNPLTVLSRFRTDFHGCLTARADALFELTDALLCTDGPVKTLVVLALAPETSARSRRFV